MLKNILCASLLIFSSAALSDPMTDFTSEINSARSLSGGNTLVVVDGLTCTSKLLASDIGEKRLCSVNPSDGSSPWDLAKRCGTTSYGMIVGCGYFSAKDTVQGWLGRQDTKDVLLNPAYKTMGVAMVNNFWVVFFGF